MLCHLIYCITCPKTNSALMLKDFYAESDEKRPSSMIMLLSDPY